MSIPARQAQTLAKKLIARASGGGHVASGEIVNCKVNLARTVETSRC